MAGDDRPYPIRDCRGGQNSALPALAIGPTEVTSALNVEWFRATVARKRRGSRLIERKTVGSALPTNKRFSTVHCVEVNPGQTTFFVEASDVSGWWYWNTAGIPPEFIAYTPIDTQASNANVVFFNDTFFYAYKSSVDRLHTTDRRVGIAAPAAPTITESAGAVTDNRKYRSVLWDVLTTNRSEPSAETSVIALAAERASAAAPAGSGTEDYDMWELQAASDDDNYASWWVVGQADLATDIEDNNTSLLNFDPAPELGLFEVPHSAIYLVVDDNRMLLAGAHESSDISMQQRVWFTPVMGDRDQGDAERIPDTVTQSNWVDLNAGDSGGVITGFAPPTLGDVLVFKRNQLWRLTRTGILETPYVPRLIDSSYGTFGHRTICPGQDASGQPCVYFASPRGPVRVGVGGVEYLGANVEDIWATVNQHGNRYTSQHATYYVDRGQYWLWVSTSGATSPNVLLVYTVATGAWATYTGPIATAISSCLAPRFVQETGKGVTIPTQFNAAPSVPYCCPNTDGQIVECDAVNPATGAALDTDLETYSGSGSAWSDGTAYAASITTPPIMPKTLDGFLSVTGGTVMADAASGVSLAVTLIPDFDTSRQRVATTTLTPVGSETVVVKRPDDCQLADARHMQVKVGDASAVASQWNVIAAEVRVKGAADR